MNTIIIPECAYNTFRKYIDTNHKYYYDQVKLFTISGGDEKGSLIPYDSDFNINYNNEVIKISIKRENEAPLYNGLGLGYLVRISASHNDLKLLKEFIDEATDQYKTVTGTVQIYHSKSRGYWDKAAKLHGQTLEHIFLPQEVKDDISNHIDKFIVNKERYLQFGRIYKLCFLLTGVPGAGKSSLIKSIAIKYNRPIYALTLTKKLEDEALTDLFGEIKENSIIVLEDIDSFFVDRQAQDINISFSAILNIFDGLFSPGNGSILFMTCNNPDRLDNALIRPGRVDRIIKFDYPKKKEVKQAFDAIVNGSVDDFNSFYKNISGTQISMAGIVDYLFRHPSDYLDCISELNTHTQLLHDITDKSGKLYT